MHHICIVTISPPTSGLKRHKREKKINKTEFAGFFILLECAFYLDMLTLYASCCSAINMVISHSTRKLKVANFRAKRAKEKKQKITSCFRFHFAFYLPFFSGFHWRCLWFSRNARAAATHCHTCWERKWRKKSTKETNIYHMNKWNCMVSERVRLKPSVACKPMQQFSFMNLIASNNIDPGK